MQTNEMCERMCAAEEWIAANAGNARLTLREMATAAGFASAFEFHRNFAEWNQNTPREWHEHHRRGLARTQAA